MRHLILALALTALLAVPATACGTRSVSMSEPPLLFGIDDALPTVQVTDTDRARVLALRAEVVRLVGDNRAADAGKVEEEAMRILGFQKVHLPCSDFYRWIPVKPAVK